MHGLVKPFLGRRSCRFLSDVAVGGLFRSAHTSASTFGCLKLSDAARETGSLGFRTGLAHNCTPSTMHAQVPHISECAYMLDNADRHIHNLYASLL